MRLRAILIPRPSLTLLALTVAGLTLLAVSGLAMLAPAPAAAVEVPVPAPPTYAVQDGLDATGLPHLTVRAGQMLAPVAPRRAPYQAVVALSVGGLDRSFRVFVPPNLTGPAPTLVALGGFGSTVDPETYMGWRRIALARHVIVMWVRPSHRSFNAGRCCGWAVQHRTDDSAALLRMIQVAGGLHPQNAHRLYLTGYSNGAMMALRFACAYPDRVAAVGVVAAAYLARGWCIPHRPVPVMHIHGMRDRVLPYRGLRRSALLGTSIPSVAQTNAVFGRVDAAHGVTALAVNLPGVGHGWPHLSGSRYDATGHLASFLLRRHR